MKVGEMKRLKTDYLTVVLMAVGGFAVPTAPAQTAASLSDGQRQATMTVKRAGAQRTYELKSNAVLRDNQPSNNQISFSETAEQAIVRSGNVMFDGLYAMAMHEARQNSVSEIKDGAYGNGDPIPLDAFETGEKWTYVWTRDLAYSVNLALAGFDPQRSVNSLLFKTMLNPSIVFCCDGSSSLVNQ